MRFGSCICSRFELISVFYKQFDLSVKLIVVNGEIACLSHCVLSDVVVPVYN